MLYLDKILAQLAYPLGFSPRLPGCDRRRLAGMAERSGETMTPTLRCFVLIYGVLLMVTSVSAQIAGTPGADDLNITIAGNTQAVIVVSPAAGLPETKSKEGTLVRGQNTKGTRNAEWLAATDLAKYIGLMTGATPQLVYRREDIDAALAGNAPVFLVGEEALTTKPDWARRIRAAAKPNPILAADAIGLLREGNRVYLAGTNDDSHYFAVAELLWRWGCRWYVPTDFGESIPEYETLAVGQLDYTYGSPFEIRGYWISWLGDNSGLPEFKRRNMMVSGDRGFPPAGHALGAYTKDLPGALSPFNFPITAPETAAHVARKLEPAFAKGQSRSISIEDGNYDSVYPSDRELMKLQWDKYMMRWAVTDPMLDLYNNIARILQDKYPTSSAKLGFLAYANMTLPPVRPMTAERTLFGMLAPIDIDPNHGMDDPDSPSRQEYRDMLYQWAKIMEGRLAIYDYDQGMLVWRDIPNPSHQVFRKDVRHYRDAGILGINTESRNAIGTTFLNLFFRGRLMWNPDEDIDALLKEFYPRFYGPAAKPMESYWSTIYKAWDDTIVTEHEHFVISAIYTPTVIENCRMNLEEAERLVEPLARKENRSRNEQLILNRLRFTRMSFEIMDGYLRMIRLAASQGNYAEATSVGVNTLVVREDLTTMNGIFTTYRRMGEKGPTWWPGEVRQYARLDSLTNGTKGRLIVRLPVEWAFHRDKQRLGVDRQYASQAVDLTFFNANKDRYTLRSLKDYPDQWEMLRTDLYAQAQGVRDSDRQSYTGDMWYRTDMELTVDQVQGKTHLMFPGLFNESWLYINGEEVAKCERKKLWWLNDYAFEWDVDLMGKLKTGKNSIALRLNCEHHFCGLFRRPFIYEETYRRSWD